jgi:hypothetical protein
MIKFIWKVTYAHVIAFFLAGLLAMAFLNYEELYIQEPLSFFMRPTTDPIVPLGMALQVFRGIIIALVIYPLRQAFFAEKYGYWKLGLILAGLSVIATFGPGIGAFDGYIFTTLPLTTHILGYPEALIWILSFLGILYLSNKYEDKKIVKILPVVLVCCIVLMGIGGYLGA